MLEKGVAKRWKIIKQVIQKGSEQWAKTWMNKNKKWSKKKGKEQNGPERNSAAGAGEHYKVKDRR